MSTPIKIVAQLTGKNFFTVSTNQRTYTIQRTNARYEPGMALLKEKKYAELLDLLDKPQALAKYTAGKVQVFDGEIYYDNKKVSGYLAEQILSMVKEGIPFEPLVEFLNNVMQNPSNDAKEDLYKFLENGQMPITTDGHFLAYKYINWDWKDAYSRTFDNSIGKVVEVDRSTVVEDRNVCCAPGLHVGALQYVGEPVQNSKRVVIVKVNPKDVVSVPTSYSFQKMRTCRYEVIGEYQAPLTKSVMENATEEYKGDNSTTYTPRSESEVEVEFKKPADEEILVESSENEEVRAIEEYVAKGEGEIRTLKQIQSRFRREGYSLDDIVDLIDESGLLQLTEDDSVGRKHWEVQYLG
jgi:hypothetical protein